jgi:hypothetical protein
MRLTDDQLLDQLMTVIDHKTREDAEEKPDQKTRELLQQARREISRMSLDVRYLIQTAIEAGYSFQCDCGRYLHIDSKGEMTLNDKVM